MDPQVRGRTSTAQNDPDRRRSAYGSEGWGFESLQAHSYVTLIRRDSDQRKRRRTLARGQVRRSVIAVCECPSRSETIFRGMPAESARLAFVCRRSCRRITGRPAAAATFLEVPRPVAGQPRAPAEGRQLPQLCPSAAGHGGRAGGSRPKGHLPVAWSRLVRGRPRRLNGALPHAGLA